MIVNEAQYIDRFMNVVEAMRIHGAYSATVIPPTPPNNYMIVSDVETFVAVGDYIYFNVATKGRVLSVVDYRTFTVETFTETLPLAGTWKTMAPYSDFGTRKTINARMLERQGGEFAYQKYPLIALRLPATINTVGGISTVDANIIIATFTNKQYKPEERLANVFKPVLYPLLYKFLNYIKMTGEFMSYHSDYSQTDRYFYGTESGDESNIANIFADPLDAIELRSIKLNYIIDQGP